MLTTDWLFAEVMVVTVVMVVMVAVVLLAMTDKMVVTVALGKSMLPCYYLAIRLFSNSYLICLFSHVNKYRLHASIC